MQLSIFKIYLVLLLIFSFFITRLQSQTLSEGDISIIAVSSNEPKSFEFVLLEALPAGESIHFTDDAWIEAERSFRGGEGIITYTPSENIPAGTIVHWEKDAPDFEKSGSFTLSGSGDNILCYQESDSITFLYGVGWAKNTRGNWEYLTSSTGTTSTSDKPSSLNDQYIIHFGNLDSYSYSENANTNGDKAQLLKDLTLVENYTGDDDIALSAQDLTFELTSSEKETQTDTIPENQEDTSTVVITQTILVCSDNSITDITIDEAQLYTSEIGSEFFNLNTWDGNDTVVYHLDEAIQLTKQVQNSIIIETDLEYLKTQDDIAVDWYCDDELLGTSEEWYFEKEGTYYCTLTDTNGCKQQSENHHVIFKSTKIHSINTSFSEESYIDLWGRSVTNCNKTFCLPVQDR